MRMHAHPLQGASRGHPKSFQADAHPLKLKIQKWGQTDRQTDRPDRQTQS